MTDISTKTNWQKLIDAANRHDIEYGFTTTRPATDEEIDSLRQRAAQRALGVDEDFVTFLRYANGFDYNCLTIPRAEVLPKPRSNDLVEYNDSLSFIGLGPVYGNLNNTYYVLYPDGKFRCISASEDVLSTYDTFFEMLTEVLAIAIGPTVIDSDPAAEIFAAPLPTAT